MNKLLLAILLVGMTSVGVMAQPASPEPPKTVVLPTTTVNGILQYLSSKPYGETSTLIQNLLGCVDVQVPQNGGIIMNHGQCPPVTEALNAHKAEIVQAHTDGVTEGKKPAEPTKTPEVGTLTTPKK